MNRRLTLLCALTLLTLNTIAQQQSTDASQVIKTLAERITLNGYAQGGYEYNDQNGSTTSTFNLKRSLLWAKAKITDRFSFLFMHDFSSVVQEYYVDFRVTQGQQLNLRVGQFKNSFSYENKPSPTLLELINVCSLSVTYLSGCGSDPLFGVNYGRDLGFMIFGDIFNNRLHYELAVMNGQGVNQTDANSDKDLLFKLDLAATDQLHIIATGQKGRGKAVDTADWNTAIAVGDNYRRDRLSIGEQFTSKCLAIRAEYLRGRDGHVDSQGAYLTARATLFDNFDLILSADWFDKNIDLDYDQTNIVSGVQYWFFTKCRLQLQYTRTLAQFTGDYNILQAQVQVAF